MLNKPNQRRVSGNMPLPFDRQPPFTEPAPPGPPAPFSYFDRYGPEEPPQPPPFRPPIGTEFPPTYWRHVPFEPPSTPDRYRPPQVNPWPPRAAPWKEPEPALWPDRPEAAQPYTPQWSRPPRDGAPTRMFEPSDNWKQTHGERHRRDHYSPSQPVAERYRPYSPPSSSNRPPRSFMHFNGRSDFNRLPHNDADHWAPEDSEAYDTNARDPRATGYSTRSTTPDRVDGRFRGLEGDERSVSPVSTRGTQHPSSPGFRTVPKRESPELPHLEALSRNTVTSAVSQPMVRTPTGSLPSKPPPSRSPSHSSTASSVNLPHVQPQFQVKPGLPPKPQFTPQSRPFASGQLPHRIETKSPPLQISSVAPSVAPPTPSGDNVASTLSTFEEDLLRSSPVALPQAAATDRSKPNQQGRNNVRHTYNAPSFVPSTLAIDAPLMYPSGIVSADPGKESRQIAKGGDAIESDMEMSLPASPAKAQGFHEEMEIKPTQSSQTAKSQGPKSSDKTLPSTGNPTSDKEDDATDASDMDMSPPASPLIKPATLRSVENANEKPISGRVESARPNLAIDTSLTLPHLAHEVPRMSSSASPVPTTPEQAAEDTGGDDSDMDMSSPASETAPSPPPVLRLYAAPLPAPALSQEVIVGPNLESPRVSEHADPVISLPEATPSPLVVARLLDHPVVERIDADTFHPRVSTPTPTEAVAREASAQPPPRSTQTTALDKATIEPGELSPPISDKTLQGEMEVVEKDHDHTVAHDGKEPSGDAAVQPKEVPMVVDEPAVDKVVAEIPLSDALRMVAKLRFHHDPHTQEARVEPILFSNRQIADPEVAPAQPPEAFVQTIAEKERRQTSDGHYDGTKHSLRRRFAQHQSALAEKVERLRREYLALHECWMVHCAKLDDVVRANALEEAAATAGRTTRRTAAMGDAVRSDLEMEQILASLGSEELTDANHLSQKNAAVIPDMVSVTKGRVDYVYDDTNNLVEDPHEFYKLETGIDDWTDEEKAVLVEKYAVHPKQFGIIAAFLPNKTPAQCVTFYYLHKNTTIDFRKAIALHNTIGKRRRSGRNGKQKGNALLADILKHDDEMSRDSTPNVTGRRKRGVAPFGTPVPPSSSVENIDPAKRQSVSRRGTAQNTPTPTQTPDPEPAPKRPRRRANPTARAVAAAAMEQDGTEDVVEEDARPAKRTRKSRKSKAEVEAEAASATLDDAALTTVDGKLAETSDTTVRKKVPGSGSSWSEEDKALFLKLLAQHGDEFKRIASAMANKTTVQVSAFYRANLTEMQLAKVAATAPKRSPTPQENGRRSASSLGIGVTIPGTENVLEPVAMSRSRSGGRMSPPPDLDGAQLSETDKRIPSTSRDRAGKPKPQQLHPSAQLQYQGLASAFAGPPRASGPLLPDPSPLTMTFPSVPYSNLGPSNFTSDPQQQRSLPRGTTGLPGGSPDPGNSTTMMLEFSEFTPQSWQVPGLTRPGLPPGPGQDTDSGLPAALETTDDLVRYLEHRARLTAGQNNDSDFM